jgi:hypothetical protein
MLGTVYFDTYASHSPNFVSISAALGITAADTAVRYNSGEGENNAGFTFCQ